MRAVRDRDYLLDRHGVIFKVIGDVHPDGHYLGYVKYHPDPRGDLAAVWPCLPAEHRGVQVLQHPGRGLLRVGRLPRRLRA